jgi:hypothetical protein
MKLLFSLVFSLFTLLSGQIEPAEGLRENPPGVWALTHAKVHTEPGTVLENATIVIRDGHIENVGKDIRIPKDATALDFTGKTIYPGFIDSWVEISTQSEKTITHDAHWNHKVIARLELVSQYNPDKKKLKSLHKLGFTFAISEIRRYS